MAAALEAELNQLEEVILGKVQQRVPSRMGEEMHLVKAFRYHDLTNSGWSDFEKFKRTMMPYTPGISDQDLHLIFQRYATEGALGYKQFAAEFVSGARRQRAAAGAFGMEEAEAFAAPQGAEMPEETLMRMKSYVYSQGPRGIASLATAFREADEENTRSLLAEAVFDVLHDYFHNSECTVEEEHLRPLLEVFRQPYSPESIAYDEFLQAMKDEPSREVRDCMRAAFRRLDTTSEGLVDINHVLRSFNVMRHPQVADGSRQPSEVFDEFATTLKEIIEFRRGQRAYPTNLVAWEEFEDYYKFVNGCFESDEQACSVLQKVWDLDKTPNPTVDKRDVLAMPAAGIPAKSRAGLHHWQKNTLPANVTHHDVERVANAPDVFLRLRQRTAAKGLRAAVDVVKHFYTVDDDLDDMIDMYEFRTACQQSGFLMREAEEKAVWEASGASGGKIQVPAFLRQLHGALTPARFAVVERAFEAVGGDAADESAVVTPVVLKEHFMAEAHPSVVKGQVDAVAVQREFLDTFSLLAHVRGGCQNGLVAFSDFLAYYEVVSSTVENDAYFDLLMHRLWSLPPVPQQDGGESPRTPRSPRRRDEKGNVTPRAKPDPTTSPVAERRPPVFDGLSAYNRPLTPRRPPPEEPEPRLDVHRRYLRKEVSDIISAAPHPSGYSAITKSTIVFNNTISTELGAALEKLQAGVSRRGLRGWRFLTEKFEQSDHRRNGAVMRTEWQRIHKTLGLGLAPEEQEVVFKGFAAGRRDGAMDYRECVRVLRGSLPEHRQAAAERLWEALQDPASGAVPAAALKSRFDSRSAPLCLTGRQGPADAKREFEEAVDYFATGGRFTAEGFRNLVLMLSAIHPDEDEFRLLTTAAFGLRRSD